MGQQKSTPKPSTARWRVKINRAQSVDVKCNTIIPGHHSPPPPGEKNPGSFPLFVVLWWLASNLSWHQGCSVQTPLVLTGDFQTLPAFRPPPPKNEPLRAHALAHGLASSISEGVIDVVGTSSPR